MIGQHFDDPAVGDPAVVAADHGLEFVPQGCQAGDLVLHVVQMGLGDVMHLAAATVRIAGETQELPDHQ